MPLCKLTFIRFLSNNDSILIHKKVIANENGMVSAASLPLDTLLVSALHSSVVNQTYVNDFLR